MEQDPNTRWIDRIRLVKFRRRLKEEIRTAIQQWVINLFSNINATIDSTSGTPSVTPSYNQGQLTLAFTGLKGQTGQIPLLRITNKRWEVSYDAGTTWSDCGQATGADGTSLKLKPDASSCVEINDAYINQSTGHLMMLIALPNTFKDCGQIKGPKGDTSYLHLKYSDTQTPTSSSQMHNYCQDGDRYIGICVNQSPTAPDSPSLYQWILFVGSNGTPGTPGSDGSKWYNSTAISGTSGSIIGPNDGKTYKVDDYILNPNKGYVYRCIKAGVGSNSTWNYVGSIKGTKGDPGNPGDPGKPGRDGSIVSKAFRFIPDTNHSIIYSKEFEAHFYYYGIGDARITLTDNNRTNIHLSILVYSGDLRWDALMAGADAYESGDVWTGPISGYLLKPNGIRGEEVILPKADPHGIIYKDTWYGTITVAHQLRWKTGDVDLYQPLLIDLHGEIENLKEAEMLEELFSDGMTFLFDINK